MKKKKSIILILTIITFYVIIAFVFEWVLKNKTDTSTESSTYITTEEISSNDKTVLENNSNEENSTLETTDLDIESDEDSTLDFFEENKEEKKDIINSVTNGTNKTSEEDVKENSDINSSEELLSKETLERLTEKGRTFHGAFDYSNSNLDTNKYITSFGYALSSKVLTDAGEKCYVVGKDIKAGKYILCAEEASGEFTIKPKNIDEQNLIQSYFINKDLPDVRLNSVCYTFIENDEEHDTAIVQLEDGMNIYISNVNESSPVFAYLYFEN